MWEICEDFPHARSHYKEYFPNVSVSRKIVSPPHNSLHGYILHISNYLINMCAFTLHKETPGYDADNLQ